MKTPQVYLTTIFVIFLCQAQINGQKTLTSAEELLDIADDWESSNYDSSYYYSKKALDLSRQEGNSELEIKSLNNMGYALGTLSKYPEAYAIYQRALNLAKETKDTSQWAKTLNFIGTYYNELGDYDQAQKYFLESYEYRQYLKDTIGIAIVSGNLGLNYHRLEQYELAEKYMRQTLEIDSINKDSFYLIGDLSNLALVYKATDQLDISERLTKQSLEIARKLKMKENEALTLGNLGMIYVQAGEFTKAEQFLKESLAMRKVEHKARDLVRTYANFLSLNQQWGKPKTALLYADTAFYYNDIVKNKRQEEKILKYKMLALQDLGNYKKAMKVADQLTAVRDTMASQSRIRQLASVEGRLNLLEKENEIVKQESDIANLTSRNQRLLFGGTGLLLLFAIAYLLRSRAFNKRNAEMQKNFARDLIKSTEQERKRISSELHDSIGQSLLLIKNKILLNPKEVSQDIDLVDNAISEVRSISQALHPYQFEKLGLIKSLAYLIDQFQANSNIFYSHDIGIENLDLAENQGIYVYRIIQECINNVEKHSGAKACSLQVEEQDDYYEFLLRDNGKGFDLSTNSDLLNSLGMKTLKERALIIGGQLMIDSTSGKGTSVQLKVPKT